MQVVTDNTITPHYRLTLQTLPFVRQVLCHWGSVDSPDFSPFIGDPKQLYAVVDNPERIKGLAPGEPFVLNRFKK